LLGLFSLSLSIYLRLPQVRDGENAEEIARHFLFVLRFVLFFLLLLFFLLFLLLFFLFLFTFSE
jgi:hypothetical protein